MTVAPKTSSLLPEKRRLGLALLAGGPLTQERVTAELEKSGKQGSVLGRALLASGFPTEEELLVALTARVRIPKINVRTTKIPLETIRLVPADVARRAKLIPIERVGDILIVVGPDMGDADALAEVRRATGCLVSPIQCAPEGFDEVLASYYERAGPSDAGAPSEAVLGTMRFDRGGIEAAPDAGGVALVALPGGEGAWDDAWAAVFASDGPVPAEELG